MLFFKIYELTDSLVAMNKKYLRFEVFAIFKNVYDERFLELHEGYFKTCSITSVIFPVVINIPVHWIIRIVRILNRNPFVYLPSCGISEFEIFCETGITPAIYLVRSTLRRCIEMQRDSMWKTLYGKDFDLVKNCLIFASDGNRSTCIIESYFL